MELDRIKTIIVEELKERDIIVSYIKITGYNKDKKTIDKITMSLEDISSGSNILYEVKKGFDNIEEYYGVEILQKFIEL